MFAARGSELVEEAAGDPVKHAQRGADRLAAERTGYIARGFVPFGFHAKSIMLAGIIANSPAEAGSVSAAARNGDRRDGELTRTKWIGDRNRQGVRVDVEGHWQTLFLEKS